MPGPTRRGAVKIRHTDCQRLDTALEVGTYRGRKYTELILVRRLHTDNRIDTEHIGTDIQGSPGTVWRYICGIRLHRLRHRIHKTIRLKLGHLHPGRGIHHALSIQVRPEGHDPSVLCRISFQPFKDCLRVLQDAGTFVHGNVRIVNEGTRVPRSVLIIGNIPLIGLHIPKAQILPVNLLFLHQYLLHSSIRAVSETL